MSHDEGYSAYLNRTFVYTAPETMTEVNGELLEGIDAHLPPPCCDGLQDGCPICLCPFAVASNVTETETETGEKKASASETKTEEKEDSEVSDIGKGHEANGGAIQLRCGHIFHPSCVKESIEKHKPVCPVCRKPIREPHGSCPSATMRTELLSERPCPGFQADDGVSLVDTIQIDYEVPSGKQKCYHYHPNTRFSGTSRTAYLPHNQEGLALLARLVYAFQHGLIFTVGSSLTTHQPNTVVWTSIHHKTTLLGGPYGFPDIGYLLNCNESLDALYVPDSVSCLAGATQANALGDSISASTNKRRRLAHRSGRGHRARNH